MEKPMLLSVFLIGRAQENLPQGKSHKRKLIMMNKAILFLLAISATISAWAQTTPGSASQSPASSTSSASQAGTGGLTFTNRAGATFSVDQLASQLRNLRSAVEQSLPVLTAFNENLAATNASNRGLTGTLSDLASGVLRKNSTQSTSGSPDQTSSRWSEAVTVLRGLLTTNNAAGGVNASSAPNANTLRELATLQKNLESLIPLLQDLNGGTGFGGTGPSQVISSPGGTTNRVLSPTGR